MKTLIVCDSVHKGNTRKIAEMFSAVLGGEILTSAKTPVEIVREYDLVGFGSGIYFSKHHKQLLNLVDTLPFGSDQRVFIFSTRGAGDDSKVGKLHSALREKLEAKGYKIVGEFSCRGLDMFGPFKLVGGLNKGHPDAEDLEAARRFAEGLKR
jgi:flavodoxin